MRDPAKVAKPKRPQTDLARHNSRPAHQRLDRPHRLHQRRGLRAIQRAGHRQDIFLRRPIQRLERRAPRRRQRQQRLSPIPRRSVAPDQPALIELLEDPA